MEKIQLECSDGSKIHFSLFTDNGRCLTLGIGPIRTGKTYLKRILAEHLKANGVKYYSIGEPPDDVRQVEKLQSAFKDHKRIFYKYCDIDELHQLKDYPGITAIIKNAVISGRSFNVGLGLWVQSPEIFRQINIQEVLENTTTYFFTGYHKVYQNAIQLGTDEVKAIKALSPCNEAYLIQREAGISRTIKTRGC